MASVGAGDSKYQVDMCRGPVLKQVIVFVIPLIFSGVLQMCFHAADLMVVGRFASHRALAAVGSTGSLNGLFVTLFIGISVGANVLIARYLGAKDNRAVFYGVHTAIFFSLAGGTILAILGIIFARPMLGWMDTPEDIFDMACLYLWILFAGIPMQMLYNFGSSILRAMGDTKRPFYFLVIAGIINVLLNFFFVLVCRWDVGGVATATIISQTVSALLVLRTLVNSRTVCRIWLRRLGIHWKTFWEMMRIGVPAGFQGSCFAIANIMIQSALNTFGSLAIAGYTAAGMWEFIGFVVAGAFGQAATSFVSQNFGGEQYLRIRKIVKCCSLCSFVCLVGFAACLGLFAKIGLSFFNEDPEVIRWGLIRFSVMLPFFFTCGLQEVVIGALRGLNHIFWPTVIMIFCVCVFRIFWVGVVFKYFHTMQVLVMSYPVSWTLVILANGFYYGLVVRKLPRKNMPRS